MATAWATAAQQVIFTALDGNISATVYDDVPDLPAGMPASDFPYVVIGDDTVSPFDTDDTVGARVTVTLHIWSRGSGMKEAKTIAAELYAILNRAALTATGYRFVDCLHETTFFVREAQLRHGVTRFRLTIQAG